MLARVFSGAVQGVHGYVVEIEIQIGAGVPRFDTVGLPDAAVREARARIRSAIMESGLQWPLRAITANLAPADVRKDGSGFDLPMALGVLAADGTFRADATALLGHALFLGELGLDGSVRPVRGVLPLAVAARDAGLDTLVVPRDNAAEAGLVDSMAVLPIDHLMDLVDHLRGDGAIAPWEPPPPTETVSRAPIDLADVRGQRHARRALEVAAAGRHNMLFTGPPGAGKTMLARRLPTILPSMSREEALDVTAVYSVAGLLGHGGGLVAERPFRTPHHTISDVGLVGGGSHMPRPGEVTLAHCGVLFLDELPEFRRRALEVLRQPLEDGTVHISRRLVSVEYPAQVMMVAAMNPCPCGFLGSARRPCQCRPDQIARYRGQISGPLMDRIDIQVEVTDLGYDELRTAPPGESSAEVRRRVEGARRVQGARFVGTSIRFNAEMRPGELRRFCPLDERGERLMRRVIDELGMSARAHDRILKVARTIADLGESDRIEVAHLAEAVGYRCLDRGEAGAGTGAFR